MPKSELTVKIENFLLSQRSMGSLLCQEVMVNKPPVYSGGAAKLVDVLRYKKAEDEFTCYEIKISKSDFKSKNGHNFVGHKNYYVVPSIMKDFVKDQVKGKNIGVIIYPTMGVSKHCKRNEITETQYNLLMLNLAKAFNRERSKYYWEYVNARQKIHNLEYKLENMKVEESVQHIREEEL